MIDAAINDFYERGGEDRRLTVDGRSRLEFVRTLELLERYLPDTPARVLDVGGGTGVYAFELCARGYVVAMIDPVGLHVDRARELIEERQFGDSMTADPVFRGVVEADLADGQHRNPGGSRREELFTTAFFHTPRGLVEEATDAGLDDIEILGVEGPAWMVENLDEIDAQVYAARAAEAEPSLMGASSHLMLIGTTPRPVPSPSVHC